MCLFIRGLVSRAVIMRKEEKTMNIKKGDKWYARIDYWNEGTNYTDKDLEDCLSYLNDVAKERSFIGGHFSVRDGALMVFSAESFEEAEKIVKNDPFIARGFYRYELLEWHIGILSEDIVG